MEKAVEIAYMIFSPTCPCAVRQDLKLLKKKTVLLEICKKAESNAYTKPRKKLCGTR